MSDVDDLPDWEKTQEVDGLRVSTLPEMARIEAWLLATRYTTRDCLDTVVLCELLGASAVVKAFEPIDRLYPQDNGASVLAEVADRLAAGSPSDRSRVDLATYRGLRTPWNEWPHLLERGRYWAELLAPLALVEAKP